MNRYSFLSESEIIDFHSIVLSMFGGLDGIRDESAFKRALNGPEQHAHYNAKADVFFLAAVLIEGLVVSHPFNDGNKRTALVSGLAFLKKNGIVIKNAPKYIAEKTMLSIATVDSNVDDIVAFLKSL